MSIRCMVTKCADWIAPTARPRPTTRQVPTILPSSSATGMSIPFSVWQYTGWLSRLLKASRNQMARTLRADARRNRSRVLEAAIAAFAAEGLSVPVYEIARRAGVGTGTVSRHFPTKESLFEAIISSIGDRLVALARQLLDTEEPGMALFEFLAAMVEEGAANRALSD